MRPGPLTPLLAFALGAILLLAGLFPPAPVAPDIRGVGIQPLDVAQDMPRWMLFYPAEADFERTPLGTHQVIGTMGARALAGQFPLILVAHAAGGDGLDHHMTASYLALSGFVVALANSATGASSGVKAGAASEASDRGGTEPPSPLRRARELAAVFDTILASAHGAWIDRDRIGIIGYRDGAEVALAAGQLARHAATTTCASGRFPGEACAPAPGQTAPFRAALLLDPPLPLPDSARHPAGLAVGIIAAGTEALQLVAAQAGELARQVPDALLVEMTANARAFTAPCNGNVATDSTDICDGHRLTDLRQEHALLNALIAAAFSRAFTAAHQVAQTMDR